MPPPQSSVPAENWLRDSNGLQSEAAFAPSDGFNCSAFRVRLPGMAGGANRADQPDGAWLHALAEAPDWDTLRARPSFYGNPILFPFAYGVKDGMLRFGGRERQLAPTRWGRVAHGLVRDRAWTVERTWDDADGSHLRASIVTHDAAEALAEFPYPFRLTITYTLRAGALRLRAEAQNLGTLPMPFGFGIHPYLPLPLGSTGRPTPESGPGDEVVTSDATHANVEGPGASGTPRQALPSVSGAFDLRAGQPVTALFDAQLAHRDRPGLYVTYAKEPGTTGLSWSLASPHLNAVVEIEASPELWAMVLFAPPNKEVISPVIGTCLPGFLDHTRDAERSAGLGLLELAPQQTWSCSATFRVRPLAD